MSRTFDRPERFFMSRSEKLLMLSNYINRETDKGQ